MKIAEAGNVENPCLLAIVSKGYTVYSKIFEGTDGEDPSLWMYATKDGNQFCSFEGAPGLLGLIHMWELRGNDWQTREDEPFLLGQLPEWTE